MKCSRCGINIKKGKEKRITDFNRKGLRDAIFCEDCYKWYLEIKK